MVLGVLPPPLPSWPCPPHPLRGVVLLGCAGVPHASCLDGAICAAPLAPPWCPGGSVCWVWAVVSQGGPGGPPLVSTNLPLVAALAPSSGKRFPRPAGGRATALPRPPVSPRPCFSPPPPLHTLALLSVGVTTLQITRARDLDPSCGAVHDPSRPGAPWCTAQWSVLGVVLRQGARGGGLGATQCALCSGVPLWGCPRKTSLCTH